MQFSDVLCYVFLTITVAVSCVEADDLKRGERKEIRLEKRIGRKIGPIVMIETPIDRALQKSKVIYRRVSQSKRYAPHMTQYGVPRPRYKSHYPTKYHRKPGKKLRNHRPKHIASKYLPPSKHKKRSNKPRYGLPSKKKPISDFAHSFKSQYPHTAPGTPDFGEPPTNYANDYIPPKQSYGEPPVDSYGAPLKLNNDGSIQTSAPQSFQESTNQYEKQNYYNYQTYPPWGNNGDTNIAYSKKRPSYAKPDFDETFIAPNPQDYNDDFDEAEAYQQNLKEKKYLRKKPLHFADNSIAVNKPWRGNKKPDKNPDIIVGGQYAEPPARYAARFKPSAPMFDDNEDSFIPGDNNYEIGSSATNSPYVNYKNSNMAFSPQNLNDAFSIVNK